MRKRDIDLVLIIIFFRPHWNWIIAQYTSYFLFTIGPCNIVYNHITFRHLLLCFESMHNVEIIVKDGNINGWFVNWEVYFMLFGILWLTNISTHMLNPVTFYWALSQKIVILVYLTIDLWRNYWWFYLLIYIQSKR